MVKALVDFNAINLGGTLPGAFFALNCKFFFISLLIWHFKTSLVLLELDLESGKG
jgi:hypothetical protein